jgi:hypothetical protein
MDDDVMDENERCEFVDALRGFLGLGPIPFSRSTRNQREQDDRLHDRIGAFQVGALSYVGRDGNRRHASHAGSP